MVEYHDGIDFVPVDNALIIVDEADYFMFEDPLKFKKFRINSSCAFFSATPANDSIEEKVAAELGAAVVDKSDALMVDATVKAPSVEEKAAHIKELAKITPVLVFCDSVLNKGITDACFAPLIV